MRRIVGMCAILSAMSFAALLALWVDSYSHQIWVEWTRKERGMVALSQAGKIGVAIDVGTLRLVETTAVHGPILRGARVPRKSDILLRDGILPWSVLGLGFGHFGILSGGNQWIIFIPHWLLCLIASVPLAAWFYIRQKIHRRRQSRIAAGLCAQCGYDLRASPERCPECGLTTPCG